jgi:carbohydrate-binding DOMON domain-containing protein
MKNAPRNGCPTEYLSVDRDNGTLHKTTKQTNKQTNKQTSKQTNKNKNKVKQEHKQGKKTSKQNQSKKNKQPTAFMLGWTSSHYLLFL